MKPMDTTKVDPLSMIKEAGIGPFILDMDMIRNRGWVVMTEARPMQLRRWLRVKKIVQELNRVKAWSLRWSSESTSMRTLSECDSPTS